MPTETERDIVLFEISHVLRMRCRSDLKINERVDDPVSDIVARDILEHLERCGYRAIRTSHTP
jgi:hypothetical protein